jgi:hypothetical protein
MLLMSLISSGKISDTCFASANLEYKSKTECVRLKMR